MQRTTLAVVSALLAPAVAWATGWTDEPDPRIWSHADLNWAEQMDPDGLTAAAIENRFDPPPQASWCGPQGEQNAVPQGPQCDAHAQELDLWMLDFLDIATPAELPAYDPPPSFCGGC